MFHEFVTIEFSPIEDFVKFTYADFIYDGTTSPNKSKLKIVQNTLLRAIKRCNKEFPVQKLHDELKIDFLNGTGKKSAIKIV